MAPPIAVRSIPSMVLKKDTRAIDAWIQSTKEVQRTKIPQVNYLRDVEELMQQWPVELEAFLDQVRVCNLESTSGSKYSTQSQAVHEISLLCTRYPSEEQGY
jgi:hypothetical protein